MKKIFFLPLFILMSMAAFGQHKQLGHLPAVPKFKPALNQAANQQKMSPMASFLLMDRERQKEGVERALTMEQLKDNYPLYEKNGVLYTHAFLSVDEGFDEEQAAQYGVLLNVRKGDIFTALIPVDAIEAVSQLPHVKYVEVGAKAKPTMDKARAATNVTQVHAGAAPLTRSYFGEGVVVGIIDIGFDYTHPNFYDETGNNYRVKRVWEQTASFGTPPTGFNYGRELKTESAILAAQTDNPSKTHGTHVAGIAAGAGGSVTTTYVGVAPKSDIVLVSTLMTSATIADGIDYIQDYASSVGKPCVINMSLGGHTGPHDGTSTFDQLCDQYYVGKGRILVGSAGNEGNDNIHLGKKYTSTDTTLYTFLAFPGGRTNGATRIDIWGEVGKDFYVGAYIYNANTDQFEDGTPYLYNGAYPGNYSHTLYDNDFFYPDPCYVDISTGINPSNNKPRASMIIDNTAQDDAYRFVMIEVRGVNTQTQMWAASEGTRFVDNGFSAPIMAGNTTLTVCEIGGTGKSIISVGAYTSKNSWTAFNGSSQTADFYAPIGEIAPFSSKGPTADGRTKPDITAPGNVIVSSVNSFNSSYDQYNKEVVYGVNDGTKNWWYATMQGTSMAAPMVTGIMALWLEMYPDLTPDEAKSLMKTNAIKDAFTGNIPAAGDYTWGWGKINALVKVDPSAPEKPAITPKSATLCEGETVTLKAPSGYADYEWSNGASGQSITVGSAGDYKVRVANNSGVFSPWSDAVTVTVYPAPPIPTITKDGNTLTSSAATGNQWYRNNSAISGAINKEYTATQDGLYKVSVTSSHGCISESKSMEVTIAPSSISGAATLSGVSVYPNPAKDRVHLQIGTGVASLSYTVYDYSGRTVLSGAWKHTYSGDIKSINTSSLSDGIYNLVLYYKSSNHSVRLTVTK